MNDATKRVSTSTTIGLALGQLLVWSLETFVLTDAMPANVALAVGTVMTGAIHYLKNRWRESRHENAYRNISPGGTD